MAQYYRAVVETSAGTFRIRSLNRCSLAVEEEGLEGIVDVINLDELEVDLWAPESLIPALISWIYEMRRGVGILSANLQMLNG
jgi:hypothetical protein